MLLRSISAFLLVFATLSAHAAAPRTVFVQLFEWPWREIARECETYLGPAGFSAVQVSPPHEHIHWKNNPWWERYQVVSYKLDSRSGTEAEFKDMVKRCQQAGVDVYVDAVLNHTTGIPGGTGSGGSDFTHYNYPGIYSYNDFHHCNRNGNNDIRNFQDRYELQNCELLDLADLATESPYVQNVLANYLNSLLDMGVAGFRIDAAKHILASDIGEILSKLKRSAYIYQEIIYDSQGPVQYAEYLPNGDVMAYDYARVLAHGFQGQDPKALLNIASQFPASHESIVFVTNHDLERTNDQGILSYNNHQRQNYLLAQIFMLAWPYGYPQLYSGYKFNNFDDGPPVDANLRTLGILDNQDLCVSPWTCEHREASVAAMVEFRNQTDKAFGATNWWDNGKDAVAFSRGSFGFVAINYSNQTLSRSFSTSMADGVYCNILDENYELTQKSCSQGIKVKNGSVTLSLPPHSAVALLKKTSTKIFKK
ncbi:alpha-amylase [Bdellovibrio sp. HCB337]|uniref:alpha-amylase n=1 Tax=Bdellovibrio sp. HCB337 TaxID=3394358 RepID=UPI0039A58C94